MPSCIKIMSKSLIFVYLISAILFSYQQAQRPNFYSVQKSKKCPWISTKPAFKNQTNILKKSFLCGNKKGLKKEVKKAYKNLNLYHLFTPSGIHLSIFYLLNTPLIKLASHLSIRFGIIYKIILSIWPWFFSGFFSLKRIGGMHMLKMLPHQLSNQQIFFIFFTFDFFWGTYSMSPMSWSYSFLFLGIVFHTYQKSFLHFSLYLFSGQLLASIFSYQEIYPLSFFPSFVLTALFTPVFSVSFIDNFFSFIGINFLTPLNNLFINTFNYLVMFTNNILIHTFSVKPEITTLLFTFGILIKNKKVIFLSLLLTSGRIYNLPDSRARQSAYEFQNDFYFKQKIIKSSRDKRGTIKIEFDNSRRCSLKLLNYGKQKKCRFKKRK